jgi:hypothetical protein
MLLKQLILEIHQRSLWQTLAVYLGLPGVWPSSRRLVATPEQHLQLWANPDTELRKQVLSAERALARLIGSEANH